MVIPKTKMLFRAAVMVIMVVGPGCSSDSDTGGDSTSSLLLELTVADGVDIDIVAWRVSGGDMADMLGTIDTSAPEATASLELFGVPEGNDYLIEMEATSTDGKLTCSGSANFGVIVGVATPVHVSLACQRECSFLSCDDDTGECERINLPDGTTCANGAGSCVGGSCEAGDI